MLSLEEAGTAESIDVASLAKLAPGRDVQVLDLADSAAYRAGHIPGAWSVRRVRLRTDLARVPPAPNWVVTSDDGIVARVAAVEVAFLIAGSVRVLTGGTQAWRAAGWMLKEGGQRRIDEPNDVYLRPYDRAPEQIEQAMHDHLAWETGLVPRISRDGTLRFELYPQAGAQP